MTKPPGVIDQREEGTCGFQVDLVRRAGAVFNADWLADAPFIAPPGLFAGILITSESRLVIYLFIYSLAWPASRY